MIRSDIKSNCSDSALYAKVRAVDVQIMQTFTVETTPDSKVHGANMGPIWGRQDPGGPHFGPMNFVIWGYPGEFATTLADPLLRLQKFPLVWVLKT